MIGDLEGNDVTLQPRYRLKRADVDFHEEILKWKFPF